MAKIRALWFVIPMDLAEDGNKARIVAGNNQQGFGGFDVAQPVRPRRDAAPQVAPEPATIGYGFALTAKDTKGITHAFTTEQSARDYAQELASKAPKTLYGVFGCMGTYETAVAPVIQKKFNEDGELSPVKE